MITNGIQSENQPKNWSNFHLIPKNRPTLVYTLGYICFWSIGQMFEQITSVENPQMKPHQEQVFA
jgi:hypothetical protein